MDKIYDALRKLSSKSSKAQNTNSEYFVIGMLRVRVSEIIQVMKWPVIVIIYMFLLITTGKIYTLFVGAEQYNFAHIQKSYSY